MILEDGVLRIRDATTEDAGLLCGWWNDGRVMAHAGFPLGLQTTSDRIAIDLANDTDETHRRLILEIENHPIGEMNYRNKGEGVVEIGIKICDETKREVGFGTRFLRLLIEHLFDVRGYRKVILDTNLDNRRAQHVYEKLGFQKTAVHIDSWKNQLGVLQSQVLYQLTFEDYTSAKRGLQNSF